MPYPRDEPESKHDIVSPSTVSISSGILQPLFDSTQTIIQQIKSTDFQLKKLALKVYTYHDAPSSPRKPSKTLYFPGFCHLSSIIGAGREGGFDYDSFVPLDGMTVCHMAVKRADKASLVQHDLDNSNKFTLLSKNLRRNGMVALIQCPKTNRAGFFIPMKEAEDGSSFAAYCYIGEVADVEQMLLNVQNTGSSVGDSNGLNNEESDEIVWKPDDDDNYNANGTTNGGDATDDANNMWQPPGASDYNDSAQNDETGDDMWKPPGESDENNNDSNNLWQPPGSTTENNDETGNLWNQSDDANGNNLWQQQEPSSFNDAENNNLTMASQESKFHADSGAAAADKFYSELTRSLGTRADSILYHMRNFNGWVKATQIAELDPKTMLMGSKSNKKRKRTRHPLRILDLACGKGGDLGKWILHNRGVQSYVGSDVARGSLVDAAIRARNITKQLKDKCTFICADLGSDVPGRPKNRLRGGKMQKLLSWSLENDNGIGDPVFREIRGGGIKESDKFDVISIQFAIHYMMSSEKRARRFFQTVSELLEIGGNLIATTIDARVVMDHMMDVGYDFHFDDDKNENEYITIKVGKDACQLKFHRDIVKRIFKSNETSGNGSTINPDLFGLEYTFTLIEGQDHAAGVGQAVDLPEWLTPLPVLKQLAAEAGLTMEYASNFHEFFDRRKDSNANHAAHSALYNMNVLNWKGTISDQEWDISRMYVAVKFRKDRESIMILDDDDDHVEEEGDDYDDEDEHDEMEVDEPAPVPKVTKPPIEINMSDPAVMKMYTKAMAKARMSFSGDWKSLASDERKVLINEELAKMM